MGEALFEGSIELVGGLLRILSMKGTESQYGQDRRRVTLKSWR